MRSVKTGTRGSTASRPPSIRRRARASSRRSPTTSAASWRAGRRDRTVLNSQDPTIAKATYQAGIQVPGGVSLGGYGIPVGTAPRTVAQYPVPVEKRPNSDFIWQRNPFDLDGNGDPRHQAPGVDIVLPYWLGRYHGFVK